MTCFGAGAAVDAEAGHAVGSVARADADGSSVQAVRASNETRTTRTERAHEILSIDGLLVRRRS